MSVTINGTTGITTPSDSVGASGITFADGTTQTSGKGPAFSAYQSSAQTISSTTYTKIQFQAKEYDTNSNYDSTTNYRFTPTIAGYYQINANCYNISGVNSFITIFKNGSEYKRGIESTNAGYLQNNTVNALVYCNGSSDFVEIYGYTGTSQTTGTGIYNTYFQGFLARPA